MSDLDALRRELEDLELREKAKERAREAQKQANVDAAIRGDMEFPDEWLQDLENRH